jgi:hypothetical protein
MLTLACSEEVISKYKLLKHAEKGENTLIMVNDT